MTCSMRIAHHAEDKPTSAKNLRLMLKNPLPLNEMSKLIICESNSSLEYCSFLLLPIVAYVSFSMRAISSIFCNNKIRCNARVKEIRANYPVTATMARIHQNYGGNCVTQRFNCWICGKQKNGTRQKKFITKVLLHKKITYAIFQSILLCLCICIRMQATMIKSDSKLRT